VILLTGRGVFTGGIYSVLRAKCLTSFPLLFLIIGRLSPAATTIAGAAGLTVSVDSSGAYDITLPDPQWHFGGNLGTALTNLGVATGADAVGTYSEIAFDFQTDAPRHAALRAYGNHQAVLFTVSQAVQAPNTLMFPNWTQFPQGLHHLTYSGIFAPPSFQSFSSESPWIFFDSAANTFIFSPVVHFMTATTVWGPNGNWGGSISNQIANLPPGGQHQMLLVIEKGINRAFDTWGQTVTTLRGKTRPANDADASLNLVGYWTDNGATYYYHTGDALSYEQTLAGVKADFDRAGIGLGYIQLDSWFYPKGADNSWSNNGGGIYQYVAAPPLFPSGLGSFQRQLGIPLITHARWIDPASPYRQLYTMSGNVVLDPRYWNTVASYLATSGVATYEQDWLDDKAHTDFNLNDGETFLSNMAAAMRQQNLTVQYCMASPRHFLQSANHSNVTTIRTSDDRFVKARWTHFLYTSRLASALGIWPFTDAFPSSETSNLLVATLSAGPVGVSDAIGSLNGANLSRAVRQDGVIVKPDVPLAPVDSSYTTAARGADAPQIDAAYTDFGALRTYYVFGYTDGTNPQAQFLPSELGLTGRTYVYDYFSGKGHVVNPSDTVAAPIVTDSLYWIAAPIGPSGMAVLGDLAQFVPMGKKRVTDFTDNGEIHLTVAFANGETSRTITGYALFPPVAHAVSGSASHVTYDRSTGLFHVQVMPGSSGTASISLGISRRHAPPRPDPPSGSYTSALLHPSFARP
jgi:hypothetical protein